jgi:hypothetical protein
MKKLNLSAIAATYEKIQMAISIQKISHLGALLDFGKSK